MDVIYFTSPNIKSTNDHFIVALLNIRLISQIAVDVVLLVVVISL